MNSYARMILTSLAISVAMMLLSDRGHPSELKPSLLERCKLAFGMVGEPSFTPAAALEVSETKIALETVRQVLREKNLVRNLSEVRRELEKIRHITDSLRVARRNRSRLEAEIASAKKSGSTVSSSDRIAMEADLVETDRAIADYADVERAERKLRIREMELREQCPSGDCVVPVIREELIRDGSIDLSPKSNVLYRTPELVAKVERGRWVPSVFIITHQVYDFVEQPTIAALRSDPRFKEMPRVLLAGGGFELRNADLYREATVVKHSLLGEFPTDLKVSANEYHFAGGYCDRCLRKSVDNVLANVNNSRQQGAIFTFHSKLMYWSEKATLDDYLRANVDPVADPEVARAAIVKLVNALGSFEGLKVVSQNPGAPIVIDARTLRGSTIRIQIER